MDTEQPACADDESVVDHDWEPLSDPEYPLRNVRCKACGTLGTQIKAHSVHDFLNREI